MKRLAPYALMLLFFFTATRSFSQTPGASKPKQFNNYPGVINCTETELSKAFGIAAGQDITLSFSDNFAFGGSVISNISKYNNLQSVTLKSANFNNTTFTLSKRINTDNSITYVGHIINKNYFDGYDLKKNAAGNYQLVKIETDRLMQDCKQN